MALDKDWTPTVKMTDGGILNLAFVGPPPERRGFYHKEDVEKYLCRKLASESKNALLGSKNGFLVSEKYILASQNALLVPKNVFVKVVGLVIAAF